MNELILNVDKLHTTELGEKRILKNLLLDKDKIDDVVMWCKNIVVDEKSKILRKGKNWYVYFNNIELTINAHSYTIITAHIISD